MKQLFFFNACSRQDPERPPSNAEMTNPCPSFVRNMKKIKKTVESRAFKSYNKYN